jgi:DNA repair protein RadC
MQPELTLLRQRLLTRGAPHLSDADLLGVVLGSPQIARTLTCVSPRWSEMGRADLCSLPRFNPTRIAQVLAMAELSHRMTSRPLTAGEPISCAEQVAAAYGPRLARQHQEVFLALALDAKHRVIAEHEIARGSLTGVEVHPREVFRQLIRDGAATTIAVHNHPSGSPEPSTQDRSLCTRMCEAGQLLGIQVLDFIIVAGMKSVSFSERGWMRSVP